MCFCFLLLDRLVPKHSELFLPTDFQYHFSTDEKERKNLKIAQHKKTAERITNEALQEKKGRFVGEKYVRFCSV